MSSYGGTANPSHLVSKTTAACKITPDILEDRVKDNDYEMASRENIDDGFNSRFAIN